MAKVTMPQLGESVAEGTIGKWLKQVGDHVDKYEPLLEVITDKVNAEVPSPFEGVLKEILAEEGATVPNDAEIAIIDTGDESDGPAATEPVDDVGARTRRRRFLQRPGHLRRATGRGIGASGGRRRARGPRCRPARGTGAGRRPARTRRDARRDR